MTTTRKCSVCGKQITKGYVFDGTDYFCSKECATNFFDNDEGCVEILLDEGNRLVWMDALPTPPHYKERIDGKTLKEWIAERLDEETILVPRIQGDGQKLVMLYMVATPSYEWLLQIDSRQELTADYADKLLSIIEEQYGTYPEHGIVTKEEYDDAKANGEIWADCYEDFEEYESRCNFPVPNIYCGYGWDEIVNFGKE